jgi:methyltransferase (TIGR00027 family)
MCQGVMSMIYRVSDVEKAKQWYRRLLNTEPVLDKALYVIFRVGDTHLGLVKTDLEPAEESKINDRSRTYWKVEDMDSAYKVLLDCGATPNSEIEIGPLGTRRATVVDPSGNIFGIESTTAEAAKTSVEQQPSETAMSAAFLRALAALDEREEIRGHDYLAEAFLSEDRKASLRRPVPVVRNKILKSRPGMYEYLIARTAYFDHMVEQALQGSIPQIVFLGAGYDSRPYRFKELIKGTSLFELDIHTTQQHKMELLHQAGISIPEQLILVPINFNTDDLKEVLLRAGYDQKRKALFIWEGVTHYLLSKAVDDTLSFIKSNSPPGSTVCFDYTSISPDLFDLQDVKELIANRRARASSEPSRFGIVKGGIASFLSERGYEVVDHLTPQEMERKYLTLRDGPSAGKVAAIFCFVHASVAG